MLLPYLLLATIGCKGGKDVDSGEPLLQGISGAWRQVSAGEYYTCAINSDTELLCWGDESLAVVTDAPVDTGWIEIAAGVAHACARKSDGAPFCWGDDLHGQTTAAAAPAAALTSGLDHSCSLGATGYATCWGRSEQGATVPPNNRFDVLAAGGGFTCAIDIADATVCWGRSDETAGADSPIVPPAGAFNELAANRDRACGTLSAGGVDCWGVEPEAVEETFDGEVLGTLSLGQEEWCGITTGGTGICRGLADRGQSLSYLPTALAAGHSHGCAIAPNTSAMTCWSLDDASDAAATGP